MWWARSEVGDLYWSGSTLARRVGARVEQRAHSGMDVTPLKEWLADAPAGKRWRVWLGGRACSLQAVEPIDGVRSIEEAEAALGAVLAQGQEPVAARLAVWPAPAGALWVAGCTPAGLLETLTDAFGSAGCRCLSIRPWWAAPGLANPRDAAWCDDEVISYWRGDDRGSPSAAGTWPAITSQRAPTLRRLRATGALEVYQLDLDTVRPCGQPGFAANPLLEEGADAAAIASA